MMVLIAERRRKIKKRWKKKLKYKRKKRGGERSRSHSPFWERFNVACANGVFCEQASGKSPKKVTLLHLE
jgi:hypothetical protein